MLKQIVVVKWGTRFGPEYVNRMYAMAARNITGPFKLVCLTDDPSGLRPEVVAQPLPELGCEWPKNSPGKWRKLVLWGAEVPGLEPGPALFVDLDSAIVGNIDGYFEYGHPDDVILARNWAKPLQRLGQTSVFRYPVGRNPQILANFRADPQGVADRCHFEQHYITESVPGGIKLWPEHWTRHFRLHCLPQFPLRYFKVARLPKDAKIVTFPGGPNPGEVIDGRWFETQEQPPTRWQHVRDAFNPQRRVEKSAWKHLTRFVLPVPWLQKHWAD